MKSFSHRLAALEALEAAQRPPAPPYVCLHAADYAALDDPTSSTELRRAITEAYGLGGTGQKLYVGVCLCETPESCRVCEQRPVVSELCQP